MAIRADSYSTVAEVVPYVRYILRGKTSFDSETTPSLTEVEKFIDRASGVLNAALKGRGFTTPFNSTNANSTAVLACDEWVTTEAAQMVELTQPGIGLTDGAGTRITAFQGMHDRAKEFVALYALGWEREGATMTYPLSDGLQFTGQERHAERDDWQDSTMEQPKFTRRRFDAGGDVNSTSIWGRS